MLRVKCRVSAKLTPILPVTVAYKAIDRKEIYLVFMQIRTILPEVISRRDTPIFGLSR